MNYILMKSRKALKYTLLFKAIVVALLCVATFNVSAQQRTIITGNVTDGANEPLAGVSVVVKGGDDGVTTNVDGNFSISLSENVTTLVFRYIGFKTQEVEIGSRSIIDVVLYEDVSELDEVVVVGYGVQKKKLITGATIQVGGDNIQKLNTQNVLGALQSQAPGVNIVQHSGMPGKGFKVTIRGLGTIGNSTPLYVIDGIADADINTLNPSDIESIDVLKDAASAAIYGARAANGVILVTTKQGKAGKLQLSYDGYIGWQNVYKMPDLLNAKEYMTIINEARFISGQALYDFSQELPDYIYQSIMDGSWNGTNWMEEARNKNAVTQNH
jgi:TonB-linked SusC/RagA family outer membrane protein